jgi:hypothetical protein
MLVTTAPPVPREAVEDQDTPQALDGAGQGEDRRMSIRRAARCVLAALVMLAGAPRKPGDAVNELNPRGEGRLKVALLSSEALDATQVEPETIRFGATGTEAGHVQSWLEDVNGDGRLDTVLAFQLQDTQLTCASTSAVLTGRGPSGVAFQGSDAVRPTGCGGD